MQPWTQYPQPGENITCCCGDILTITLVAPADAPTGHAYLRTNLQAAHVQRTEIINHVEQHTPLLAGDWHDLPMHADTQSQESRSYTIRIPIYEPGVFEAKAFFLPENSDTPCWPDGPNLQIKTEPATTYAANTIYTAFVRQFGHNQYPTRKDPLTHEQHAALDAEGWTLIPQSGTFRDLGKELDHIIDQLGFRIIQLLPIHPVPTTFARMGRFGSPFASIDFFNVDPALAEFDRSSTPLEQFGELVNGIHSRGARVFLDLPINHTGWASYLQVHHPEWFARNDDNTFASPGAWGVVWEDLSELDYQNQELWHYMADVFLFWCQRGVDGFRCDAGYMIPLPVWEYIVAKVRNAYPETTFLLEGLGGSIHITEQLLSHAGLDWAYSEIFQVYDRPGLEHQLRHDHASATRRGPLMHFAETHDNNRLAATSPAYARMRTALTALTADSGAFGITNGVEWFATAKVDVHGAPNLNWGVEENQIDWLQRINHVLMRHPAFFHGAKIEILPSDNAILQVLRTSRDGSQVLVLVNLDTEHEAIAHWNLETWDPQQEGAHDLISQTNIALQREANTIHCSLPPGGAYSLATEPLTAATDMDPVTRQRAKALALAVRAHFKGLYLEADSNPDPLVVELLENPAAYCTDCSGLPECAILTCWQAPQDAHRIVMLPRQHILLIKSPYPFRVTLSHQTNVITHEQSLPQHEQQNHFAILIPSSDTPAPAQLDLTLTAYTPDGIQESNSYIQYLGYDLQQEVQLQYDREMIRNTNACAILSNGCGAISQVRLEWAHIESQYDALLAANLHRSVPEDRNVLLTRCRVWLVHKGYSHELGLDCTRNVQITPGKEIIWRFDTPAGMGRTVPLACALSWQQERNHINFQITRQPAEDPETQLSDNDAVQLIIRPDIEHRNCHSATKAYAGPEHHFPASITPSDDGFLFSPGPAGDLRLQFPDSSFTSEPEWLYDQPHPFEADRGLEPSGDLFSPGYFTIELQGGDVRKLEAFVPQAPSDTRDPTPDTHHSISDVCHLPLSDVLRSAIRDFVVRRDDARTVIAGYPWFLDWGRDTLICLRGMIAADMLEEARDILKQFASFEREGTIPNMIRGTDDRDRDTSDAPLWLFTACQDYIHKTGSQDILDMPCGDRPLLEILQSLAHYYIEGTPNGIHMDPESGLIYSPSHFTWMDTNYPAGTPRQGYPIEIQALWFAALQLLATHDKDDSRWQDLADQVQSSILRYYRIPETHGALSDCLHAAAGQSAKQATADNSIRPNQLLAITLGAVTDPVTISDILRETTCLLIPGAIRSLADRRVCPPLPINGPSGLLNNPDRPYWGQYRGDEDTRRKPAYHNGTAWTWPFPSYCEAMLLLDRDHLTPIASEILASILPLLQSGCIAHLPEVLDGNAPHQQRGCCAQAWGATEAYRVLQMLAATK